MRGTTCGTRHVGRSVHAVRKHVARDGETKVGRRSHSKGNERCEADGSYARDDVVQRTREWLAQTRRLKEMYRDHPEAWEDLDEDEKRRTEQWLRATQIDEREGTDLDETQPHQETKMEPASERMKRKHEQVLSPIAFADFPDFEAPPAFHTKNHSWEAFREQNPWVARAMEELREKEKNLESDGGGAKDDHWKEYALEDLLDPYSNMSVTEQCAKQKEWVLNQAVKVDEEMERWIAGDNMDETTLRKDLETINADLTRAYNKSKELHGKNFVPLGVVDASFWDKKVVHIRIEEGAEDFERWSKGPTLDIEQVFEIKSLHRAMYLLRKAFSSGDPPAAMELLRKHAMYEDNMKYSDEVASLEGFPKILNFYHLQKSKGVTYDLQQIWCVGPFFFSGESGNEILLDYSRVVVMYYMFVPAIGCTTDKEQERLSLKSTFFMNPRGKVFKIALESDVMIHEGFTLGDPE